MLWLACDLFLAGYFGGFIFTLAMAIGAIPWPGGLIALESILMGLTIPGNLLRLKQI